MTIDSPRRIGTSLKKPAVRMVHGSVTAIGGRPQKLEPERPDELR